MPPSTDDDETSYLRQFVLDYVDGKLVCTEKHDRASLRATFPMLCYAVDEPTIPEDVGLVWTHFSLMEGWRYPRGYPYFTLNYLTKAQTERVRKAIAAETERRKLIEV